MKILLPLEKEKIELDFPETFQDVSSLVQE